MSILLKGKPIRRDVLRGLVHGGAVTVAVPFLDCFLNNHGTALASGKELPARFGTWFWGLGHSPGIGVSSKTSEIELLEETRALERHKPVMNYIDGLTASLDGNANYTHYSGLMVVRTGSAPS